MSEKNKDKFYIQVNVDDELFYISNIDKYSKTVKLTKKPLNKKIWSKYYTCDENCKWIIQYFDNCLRWGKEFDLFTFNKEKIEIIPLKIKNEIINKIKSLKENTYWDDKNELDDLEEMIINKDIKKLKKLRNLLTQLFLDYSRKHELLKYDIEYYSTFKLDIININL